MPTFAQSIDIDASPSELFWLMQDYGVRLEWDPFLIEARMVDGAEPGRGARAWCVDRRRRGMETEYVSFKPPERVAVRMTKGPWMFRSFAGAWIYAPTDLGTRVTFKYHVEARPRIGRLSDWVLERIFAREMRKRLVALKTAVERTDLLDRFAGGPGPTGTRAPNESNS